MADIALGGAATTKQPISTIISNELSPLVKLQQKADATFNLINSKLTTQINKINTIKNNIQNSIDDINTKLDEANTTQSNIDKALSNRERAFSSIRNEGLKNKLIDSSNASNKSVLSIARNLRGL